MSIVEYLVARQRVAVVAVVLVLSDMLGIATAFAASGMIGFEFNRFVLMRSYDVQPWSRAAEVIVLGGMAIFWLSMHGHYIKRMPRWIEIGHVARACLFALLVDGFLQYATKYQFSRLWLVSTWVLSPGAMALSRYLGCKALDRAGLWKIQALIVGNSTSIEKARRLLTETEELGYVIAAEVGVGATVDVGWQTLMEQCRARVVILCLTDDELRCHGAEIRSLSLGNIPFILLRDMEGLPVSSLSAQHILGREVVLLIGSCGLENAFGRWLKMLFDTVVALVLLVIAMPVMVLLAGLIAIEQRPIFFLHERIGRNGRRFRCIKFRTMKLDAVDQLQALLDRDPAAEAEWNRYHKLKKDPRVTLLGGWMRRSSLDELPQLINVLNGDMSLVGPRPITDWEVAAYGEDMAFYALCRPGITGLWQVSGRNNVDLSRRIELDRWYVVNWSFWLDIILLLKTLPIILNRRGAY